MYRFFIFISWVISFVCFNRLVQTDNHCVQQFYAGLGLIFLISFPALFKHLAGKRTEVTLGGKTVKNGKQNKHTLEFGLVPIFFR